MQQCLGTRYLDDVLERIVFYPLHRKNFLVFVNVLFVPNGQTHYSCYFEATAQ